MRFTLRAVRVFQFLIRCASSRITSALDYLIGEKLITFADALTCRARLGHLRRDIRRARCSMSRRILPSLGDGLAVLSMMLAAVVSAGGEAAAPREKRAPPQKTGRKKGPP